MPCYHPIDAWRISGQSKLVFVEHKDNVAALKLPCGQCIGCKLERSRMWAVRCMHEAQLHDSNMFVTLTYDDEHLPAFGALVYADFQRFIRALRKQVGKLRFYMCGEYGALNLRPHFHACIFGYRFDDLVYLRKLSSGFKLYRSTLLEKLWTRGYSSVGDVSFESAAYVARYICAKLDGQSADWVNPASGLRHYERVDKVTGEVSAVSPEFTRMSLKPGIGSEWFEKYGSEVFPSDYVISRGVKVKPPRYYFNKLKEGGLTPELDEVEYMRFCKALDCVVDSTVDRLHVREHVAKAALTFKKRSLDK